MPHDGQTQGPRGWPNILGLLRGTNLRLTGKAGATAGAGLAGGTTSGAPTSGAFDVGEAVIGQDGSLWICTVAGSPGTFVQASFTSPLTTKADLMVGGTAGAASRLGVGADAYVLTADSAQTLGVKWAAAATGSAGLYTAYIHVREEQTSGTDGGTFTSGAWRTRVLNTEVDDAGSHVSVASNQMTLDAGTYRAQISAPAFIVNQHQAKLFNVTDAADILLGQVAYAQATTNVQTAAEVRGRFTIAASKVLEVRHRCQTTAATNGFGIGSNQSWNTCVFTVVEFWKE